MTALDKEGNYEAAVSTGTPAAFWNRMGFTLDLDNPDVTTPEEWERWREGEKKGPKGYPHPSYEVLGEFGRADAVKRWLSQTPRWEADDSFFTPLMFMTTYAIRGDETGTIWEINNSTRVGHTRAECVDALAVTFLNAPSLGLHRMSDAVRQRLREIEEPEQPFQWPAAWSDSMEVFSSGLDFTLPELQEGELRLLEEWYGRVAGEVPPGIRLLGTLRPNLLKAYRNRVEHAVKVLPAQAFAYIQLHYETVRGWEPGIREWASICRGLGLTRPQAGSAMVFAMMYGGVSVMSLVERAAGDILGNW